MSTLEKSGASLSGPPPPQRDIASETNEAYSTLVTLLPSAFVVISPARPNGPPTPKHPLLTQSMEFQASLIADLVSARSFADRAIWKRCIAVYDKPWLGEEGAAKFAESACSHFFAIDQVS